MCAVHSAEYRLTPPIIQLASNHHHVSIRSNLDSSGSGSASGGCSNDGLEWERERKRWSMNVLNKEIVKKEDEAEEDADDEEADTAKGKCQSREGEGQEADTAKGTRDATDEEWWQRRLEKRRDIIERIKKSPEYAYGERAEEDGNVPPRTPDPTERTSKRQWEQAMAKWRQGLRQP